MDKTSAYSDIEKTLQEIFFKNLLFFKEFNPIIYNKVTEFEKKNEENYSIEFVDNKFQLINLKTNQKFYEDEPFQDSINKINNFELSSAFNLINLETLEKRNHYDNEINAYVYLNQFIENFKDIEINIDKFIFLGTLLGVHLNDFDKVIKAKSYLIIEPNIEIFRLSMFMTDYKVLSEDSKLFFAIGEDELNFKNIISNFLEYKYEFNNLIHFELAHKIYEPIVDKLSIIFTHSSQMRYPFSDYLISLNRFTNYFIDNSNKLLNLSKTYNFLEDKDVLLLGAGPSIEKNLDFISQNKDKFIIVAVAATLKILASKNIIPDIIITVDGQNLVKEQFKVSEHIYIKSIILSSIKLDEEIYSIIKMQNLFFFQDSINIYKNLGNFTGVTVGDISIDLLLSLGVKNLYLLGIDAALDTKTGKTHTNSHIGSKTMDIKKKEVNKIDFDSSIVYVKGNFEKKVPTFMEYTEMIEEINEKFKHLDSSFNIYNLSTGAYFENTTPIKASKIINKKELGKKDFKTNLLSNLNQISKSKLNSDIKKFLVEEQKVLSLFKPQKNGLVSFEKFKSIQKKHPNSIYINILDKYFKLVLPYFTLIKDENKSDSILENQLKQIINKMNSLSKI